MRAIGRSLFFLTVFFAILVAGLFVFRAQVAEFVLTRGLTAAGVETPSLEVRAIDLAKLEIAQLRAGREAHSSINIERLELRYDWRALIYDRKIDALTVGPGRIAARLDDDGVIELAGLRLDRSANNENTAGGASFVAPNLVEIAPIEIALTGAGGAVAAQASGRFALADGGAINLSVKSNQFSADDVSLEAVEAAFGVGLKGDGAVTVNFDARGDVGVSGAALRGASLEAAGTARSWRALLAGDLSDVVGDGQVTLKSGDVYTDDAPLFAQVSQSEAQVRARQAIRFLSVSGGVDLSYEAGSFSARVRDGAPLALTSDRGDALLVRNGQEGAGFAYDDDGTQINLEAELAGFDLSGITQLSASRAGEEAAPWVFSAQSAFDASSIGSAKMGETRLGVTGRFDGNETLGGLQLTTDLKKAIVGPVRISDAPLRADLTFRSSLVDETLTVSGRGEDCVLLERLAVSHDVQKMSAAVAGARLCNNDGDLLTFFWGESANGAGVKGRLAGRIEADSGTYVVGETVLQGTPPSVSLDADYQGAAQPIDITGEVMGGRMLFNDALALSRLDGGYEMQLTPEGVSGAGVLRRARLAQAMSPPFVAPVFASGNVALSPTELRSDYALTSEAGEAIGSGSMTIDLASGNGAARYRSGQLIFGAGELAPERLAPVLRGFISETSGAASVDADLAWGRAADSFTSSADIELDDITFRGPSVAVSQTQGLAGDIRLSSLAPLKSDGVQNIRIGKVDMGALILENGEAEFTAPGDETVRLIKAEFPWFGGAIGAYDSVLDMRAGRSVTELKAQNVDLGELLAYLQIDGLSGEGVVEGVLPIVVEEGRARIENGVLSAIGAGVIRYQGSATNAAASANDQAKLAFDILRNLKFEKLSATINGPLDGDLEFQLFFEGANEIPVAGQRVSEPVVSPVIYRINLQAPLLALIQNARQSTDYRLLIEQTKKDKQAEQSDQSADAAP